MPKVMKPSTPIERRGRNHIDWFSLFAEAHRTHPWQWVAVYEWKTTSSAWRAQRAIRRGDVGCDVPGGVGKWETKVGWETNGKGVLQAFLYVRKVRGGAR